MRSFVLASLIGLLSVAPSVSFAGLTIYLPQDASYKYVNATRATTIPLVPANWSAPTFDDSNWFTGNGYFGNDPAISVDDNFLPQNVSGPQTPDVPLGTVQTQWDPFFDPYLRTHFTLPAQVPVTLWMALDNGLVSFYINGVKTIIPVNAEGRAHRWETVFDIPAAYLHAGDNVVAFNLEDHGVRTGFAAVITADDLVQNPIPFSVPVPAAAWSGLSLMGALGVAAKVRRIFAA